MDVQIENSQEAIPIPLKTIQTTARDILNALDSPDGELSILIVDDARIAELNLTYLNRTGPTNVIAFPMQEGAYSELTPNLLGDVVISVETAAREAEAAGMSLERRFNQLLVHGILHLFGYDHIHSEAAAAEMEKKSSELMEGIRGKW